VRGLHAKRSKQRTSRGGVSETAKGKKRNVAKERWSHIPAGERAREVKAGEYGKGRSIKKILTFWQEEIKPLGMGRGPFFRG